jgi:hypothetical protein
VAHFEQKIDLIERNYNNTIKMYQKKRHDGHQSCNKKMSTFLKGVLIGHLITDKKIAVTPEDKIYLQNFEERVLQCQNEFNEFKGSTDNAQEKWEALISCMKEKSGPKYVQIF